MSPIVGLTTKQAPKFPELGTIRKGAPKPERGPGRDLTYLRFASERPEVVKAFTELYGEQPTKLTVYLPYKTVDENFSAWMEEWGASGLVRRCDREHVVQWFDKTTGKQRFEQQPCMKDTSNPCLCTKVGRLKVVLLDLVRLGYMGFVTVLTSSAHDIMMIQGSLEAAAGMSPAGLNGIPFVLWREMHKISTPGKAVGERSRRAMSLLRLAPDSPWVQAQLAAAERRSYALLSGDLPALPAPSFDTETGEVFDRNVPTNGQVEPEEEEADFTETPPDAWDEAAPAEAAPTVNPARERVEQLMTDQARTAAATVAKYYETCKLGAMPETDDPLGLLNADQLLDLGDRLARAGKPKAVQA